MTHKRMAATMFGAWILSSCAVALLAWGAHELIKFLEASPFWVQAAFTSGCAAAVLMALGYCVFMATK